VLNFISLNLISAVLLGGAMLVAGAAKVVARDQWPAQAREMGAPAWAISILPWVELVIGAALIVGAHDVRRIAATAAALLLAVFSVQIAKILQRGQRPVCACFGSWSARPLGVRHLGRNFGLVLLAVVVIW
jgi:hypothetical protein